MKWYLISYFIIRRLCEVRFGWFNLIILRPLTITVSKYLKYVIQSQLFKVYLYLVNCHILFIWCIVRRSKGSIFLCTLLSFLWTCIVWRGWIAFDSLIFLRGLDYKKNNCSLLFCYVPRNRLLSSCTNSYVIHSLPFAFFHHSGFSYYYPL